MSYLLKDFDRLVEFGGSKEVVVTVRLGDGRPSFGNGVEGRIELPGSGITLIDPQEWHAAHLHGAHLRCEFSAVNWMEADQVRLGDVRRSNTRSSRRMMPFPAAASCTSSSWGEFFAARQSGTRKRARRGQIMVVNVLVSLSWEVEEIRLCTRPTVRLETNQCLMRCSSVSSSPPPSSQSMSPSDTSCSTQTTLESPITSPAGSPVSAPMSYATLGASSGAYSVLIPLSQV